MGLVQDGRQTLRQGVQPVGRNPGLRRATFGGLRRPGRRPLPSLPITHGFAAGRESGLAVCTRGSHLRAGSQLF